MNFSKHSSLLLDFWDGVWVGCLTNGKCDNSVGNAEVLQVRRYNNPNNLTYRRCCKIPNIETHCSYSTCTNHNPCTTRPRDPEAPQNSILSGPGGLQRRSSKSVMVENYRMRSQDTFSAKVPQYVEFRI
jgi:hypothetical protein